MSSGERSWRREGVVSRLYGEGWGRGDFDVVSELLDADIVWTAIEGTPDAATYRGFEPSARLDRPAEPPIQCNRLQCKRLHSKPKR
jgi:ketosteroid isomerase-like protein